MNLAIENLNTMLALERDAAKAMVAGKGRTEKIDVDGHPVYVDVGMVTVRAHADRIAKTQEAVDDVNQAMNVLSAKANRPKPTHPGVSDVVAEDAFKQGATKPKGIPYSVSEAMKIVADRTMPMAEYHRDIMSWLCREVARLDAMHTM